MLKIENLNQYHGQSHTLWVSRDRLPKWAIAARRTPGREAGPDHTDRDVPCATGLLERWPC
jgi:hypothetical protein